MHYPAFILLLPLIDPSIFACSFIRKVAEVTRAKVDIKDFHPSGLAQLQNAATSWVGMGKHLCGAATDLTLRCCSQWVSGTSTLTSNIDKKKGSNAIVALLGWTCCLII